LKADTYPKVGFAAGNRAGSRTARIQPDGIIHSILKALFAAKLLLCSFDRDVSEEKLNLFEFATGLIQSRAHVMRRSCGAKSDSSQPAAASLTMALISFGVKPFPTPALLY
jgi:hypothetical protein